MNEQINVFISQPMNGLDEDTIKSEREHLLQMVKDRYPNKEVKEIKSFFEDFEVCNFKHKPVLFLGRSITAMCNADVCVFAKGWDKARGCKIEHQVAEEYGINIILA